jgi:hypothetical protein
MVSTLAMENAHHVSKHVEHVMMAPRVLVALMVSTSRADNVSVTVVPTSSRTITQINAHHVSRVVLVAQDQLQINAVAVTQD